MQVPSQSGQQASGHGTTCIHPVVVGEVHLHPHSTGMIRQVDLIVFFSVWKLARGWQVVVNWGCPGTQHREDRHRLSSSL